MRKSLVLLLCLSLIGCVHYTPKERAAMRDHSVLKTMTDEELDAFEAKVRKQQRWLNAFSAGARGFGEGTVSALRETTISHSSDMTPTTLTPQQQYTPIYQPTTSFSDGYRDGYKDGYQYTAGGGIKPIAPISPIPPIPNIGETTYKDGYTRGIIDGQRQHESRRF